MLSRSHHILFALALSTLLLTLSVTVIILNGVVVSNFEKYLVDYSLRWNDSGDPDIYRSLRLTPNDISTAPTDFIFACAALSIFVAITGLGRVAGSSTVYVKEGFENKVKKRWSLFARSSGTISVLVMVAGLVLVFNEECTSSKFHYTDAVSTGQHFTRESWVCQMRQHYSSAEHDYFHWTCNDAQAARWLLVPLLIVSSLLTSIAFTNIPEQAPASDEDQVDMKSVKSTNSDA